MPWMRWRLSLGVAGVMIWSALSMAGALIGTPVWKFVVTPPSPPVIWTNVYANVSLVYPLLDESSSPPDKMFSDRVGAGHWFTTSSGSKPLYTAATTNAGVTNAPYIQFNIDDFLSMTNVTVLDNKPPGFISYWCRSTNLVNAQMWVWRLQNFANNVLFSISHDLRMGHKNFAIEVYSNGTVIVEATTKSCLFDSPIAPWQHVVVGHDGTELRVWVDGVTQAISYAASKSNKTAWLNSCFGPSSATTNTIGCYWISAGRSGYYNGRLGYFFVSTNAPTTAIVTDLLWHTQMETNWGRETLR